MANTKKTTEDLKKEYTAAKKKLGTVKALRAYTKVAKAYAKALEKEKRYRAANNVYLAYYKEMAALHGTRSGDAYDELEKFCMAAMPAHSHGPAVSSSLLGSLLQITPDDSELYVTVFCAFIDCMGHLGYADLFDSYISIRRKRAAEYPAGSQGRIVNLFSAALVFDNYDDDAEKAYSELWKEVEACTSLDEEVEAHILMSYTAHLTYFDRHDEADAVLAKRVREAQGLVKGCALLLSGEMQVASGDFKGGLDTLKAAHSLLSFKYPKSIYTQIATSELAEAYEQNNMSLYAYSLATEYINSYKGKQTETLATLHYHAAVAAFNLNKPGEAYDLSQKGYRIDERMRYGSRSRWLSLMAACCDALGDKEMADTYRYLAGNLASNAAREQELFQELGINSLRELSKDPEGDDKMDYFLGEMFKQILGLNNPDLDIGDLMMLEDREDGEED